MLNVFLRNVGARPELLILTLMVMIIAMLIIPCRRCWWIFSSA